MSDPAIEVSGLSYAYPDVPVPVVRDVSFSLERGARCVLVGPNGAGKSTLLRILGGKHMVPQALVRVLGRPAFHDTGLAAHLTWIGGAFPLNVDITVQEILDGVRALDPLRCERLLHLLDVNRGWRMHRVSDGQRRRVQLLLALLRPSEVLLLDEATRDLDLLGRAELLALLREESELRGATIVYATHILDRLEEWATHLALMHEGRFSLTPIDAVAPLVALRAQGVSSPLFVLLERWMRSGCREL
ncbi:MAG: ATP-binding cassette domain-containing protein [Deltaproteobacteria bacterium]|nr:ATP-binding cassette domain-containing protein [Deltaproteobacteria bacterium]